MSLSIWTIMSINQSINPSINQSINPSINRSINQSIDQSMDQSINQSTEHPTSQSSNQSEDHQPVNSINQSTNRWMIDYKFRIWPGQIPEARINKDKVGDAKLVRRIIIDLAKDPWNAIVPHFRQEGILEISAHLQWCDTLQNWTSVVRRPGPLTETAAFNSERRSAFVKNMRISS